MTSTLHTSLDLCAVRVAKLTTAGAPDAGASNGYQSCEAPVKLDVTLKLKTGRNLEQTNGCGTLVNSRNEPDTVKSIDLALDLCQLDSYLLEILTGVSLFTSGGNAVGFQMPAVGSSPDAVCLEGWTKVWDGDSQLVPAYTSPSAAYLHWVFPFSKWTPGTFSLQGELAVFPVSAKCSENTSITANGPFDDWPTEVANEGGVTRLGGWFYDDTLPTCDGEYVEVTSAAS